MTEKFVNSKNLSEIPADQRIRLWDLKTGQEFDFALSAYERNKKMNDSYLKVQGKGTHSDWWRRHYNLNEFQGQKIDKWHRRTKQKIEVMTLPLWDEIQRRNPLEEITTRTGTQNYYYWKEFIIDKEEIIEAKKAMQPDLAELVKQEVAKVMAKEPVNETKETEPQPIKVGRKPRAKKQ